MNLYMLNFSIVKLKKGTINGFFKIPEHKYHNTTTGTSIHSWLYKTYDFLTTNGN